ncbi:DNA internalization-related competence protein ComEC/Rec2 [Pseudothauera hydrothermalis]|uniref:DNA internalization-related competence protein ComEC/Rec2 n=1 Tax=Pseudothauera hydrothermalis TaxID=2184083 RepID=UPI000E0901F6|nr:DNA internalization-related competence protein ComEC/Rec2 [Pseudothauera hydrothermalis]
MRYAVIGFALGVWAAQQYSALPAAQFLLCGALIWTLIAAAGLLCGARLSARSKWVLVGVLACSAGLLWASGRAYWRLADALPMQWEGRDLVVTGVIAELPQTLGDGLRFVFEIESAAAPLPRRVLLSWYADRRSQEPPPTVRAGERWQLMLRLKRPHGLSNPHGFDYEAWLLGRNLRATGYVRHSAANRRLADAVGQPMLYVHRLRESVRERFAKVLGERPHTGILTALAIGDQRAITPEQWEVFRRTGVNHLVAISGLHVSLIALCAGGLVGWLWRRVPSLMLYLPLPRARLLAALLAAMAYALLAGMGIPVQRALLMLAVAVAAMLSGRDLAASRVLALVLLAVLVVDPWAVLSAGFWLSFAAVGVIMLTLGGRLQTLAGWRAALRVQLAITLALAPALLVLFQGFSLVSPLANAWAIPLVSFVITPLVLLAVLVPLEAPLYLAHGAAELMMAGLGRLAAQDLAMWQQAAPPAVAVAAACAGVLWLLLPRGTPAPAAGLLAVAPLLIWTPSRPPEGAFVATVLDVGQGQAVHVQTARHDLLIDAGPAFGPLSDAGQRVVLPYLRAAGVSRLDRLVLTHGDADHAGGARAIVEGIPVSVVMSNQIILPAAAGVVRPCRAKDAWVWDGVHFRVLHPPAEDSGLRGDNDRACVLRIEAAGAAMLVASDIEKGAERVLLTHWAGELASEILVAPHHGSRSSSTPALVQAVRPREVLYSVGYLNPFGHPHPQVWARWAASGARNWRTDSQGALRVTVGAPGVAVEAERERRPRYWHGR